MYFELPILDKSFPIEHEHCVNCFLFGCKYDNVCSLVNCNFCGVRLHKCKLEDHVGHICCQVLFLFIF